MKTCGSCRWWSERPGILCRNRKSAEWLEEKRPDDSCDEWEAKDDGKQMLSELQETLPDPLPAAGR